jgi:hypothetical protein
LLVHQLLPAYDPAEWETVRQTLCHNYDVWPDARMFRRKVLARPTETRLDFIENEKQTVRVANVSQACQERRGRGDVASLADDRFDDDGGRVLGRRLLRENEFELVETLIDERFLGSFGG